MTFRSISAHVEDIEGETHVLWHGTDTHAALSIVRSQHFIPSFGLLGDGVYLAPGQAKAEQLGVPSEASKGGLGMTASTLHRDKQRQNNTEKVPTAG